MIKYALKCADDHHFDGWFRDSTTFETLLRAGQVSCAVCGVTDVTKAMMAPRIGPSVPAAEPPAPPQQTPEAAAPAEIKAGAQQAAQQALAELRRKIEREAVDVGRDFAREARAIHAGDEPQRMIYGEARPEETRSLLEDGIPVAPLPFTPRKLQ